jgi:NADH dehydrogenase
MKILLSGASGEIGTPLITRLAEQGHELYVISRQDHPPEARLVHWIRADILNPESLERACRCQPEVVVHMAAVTHSTDTRVYDAVNLQGTRNMVEASSAIRPRHFVHLSTRAVGAAGGGYSASKEQAEQVVQSSNLPWTILRPAEVYGSGGNDPILSLASDLRRRPFIPILGDGSYGLSPVFAGDLVEAVSRVILGQPGSSKTYVLAGPENFTYLQLVDRLEALQGLPRRWRIPVPVALARVLIGCLGVLGIGNYVPDQVPRLLLPKSYDSSAAVRDLQFTPRSLEEILPLLLAREAGR